jgi:voltage-gated hydrogen channel 1
VILLSFALEVGLRNMFEGQIGSTIVVLRLWRVFQIVEEFGAGAQEHMEGLYQRIEELEKDTRLLLRELDAVRMTQPRRRHS